MNKIFNSRAVYILKHGKVVETFPTLTAFWRRYPVSNISTLSKRIRSCADGWLPDGKVARFEESIKDPGRPLATEKAHPHTAARTIRDEINDDLQLTEAKIDELYAMCEAGKITIEERQREVGWLQNHVAVLQNRLKQKFK